MKTRKILNVLMVLSIVLIVLCGAMAVRSIKGPTVASKPESEQAGATAENTEAEEVQEEQNTAFLVQNKVGIVTVERSGIAYEVDENTEIRTGDIFLTRAGAEVALVQNETARIALSADTELTVTDCDAVAMILGSGEIFADLRETLAPVQFTAGDVVITAENTVATVTVQPAAYTVYVYSGEVTVSGEKLVGPVTVNAGQTVSVVADEAGNLEVAASDFLAEALSDAQLTKLQNCGPDESFCFTGEDLAEVKSAREKEKAEAQQAMLLAEEQAKEKLAQEQAAYEQASEEYAAEYAEAMESIGATVKTDENGNVIVEQPKYCTISIRCDTILNNMDNLAEGKEGYVPSDGSILSTSKVMFQDGETVFDVLQRACAMTGVQLEYSWTPLYNSYYIEGINNLYEFDCGSQSGWMYKVNGWFPNYGCSSYTVKEGDAIVWCYTCNGLGADVGGRVNH